MTQLPFRITGNGAVVPNNHGRQKTSNDSMVLVPEEELVKVLAASSSYLYLTVRDDPSKVRTVLKLGFRLFWQSDRCGETIGNFDFYLRPAILKSYRNGFPGNFTFRPRTLGVGQ